MRATEPRGGGRVTDGWLVLKSPPEMSGAPGGRFPNCLVSCRRPDFWLVIMVAASYNNRMPLPALILLFSFFSPEPWRLKDGRVYCFDACHFVHSFYYPIISSQQQRRENSSRDKAIARPSKASGGPAAVRARIWCEGLCRTR